MLWFVALLLLSSFCVELFRITTFHSSFMTLLSHMSSSAYYDTNDQHSVSEDDKATSQEMRRKKAEARTKQNTNERIIKWTLMTSVNNAFFEMFLNWKHYYDKLELGLDMIIVAEDDVVLERLQRLYENYTSRADADATANPLPRVIIEKSGLHTLDPNGSFGWRDEGYKTMMSARPTLIRQKLQAGYNILFTDVDIIWQQNPLPYFNDTDKYDLFMQREEKNKMCGGFWAMVSTERTISLVTAWESHMLSKPGHNQQPLNRLLRTHKPRVPKLGLPMDRFVNGRDYKKRFRHSATQREQLVVIHNNYKATGFDKKKQVFQEYGLWFDNTHLPANQSEEEGRR
jgi:hypothetical protein